MTAGRRRSRKTLRGGNFYGASGAIAPGAMQWGAVENVAASPVTGKLIPNDGSEMKATKLGGRRHGKKTRKTKKVTRKGGKKHRKSRRKMRGGANWVSSAGVGAAFKGDGVAGLGDYSAYGAKMPVSGGPEQNPDGAYRA